MTPPTGGSFVASGMDVKERRGCGTGLRSSGNQPLATKLDRTKYRVRSHLFRAWTACAILAAYVYGWLYVPEMLTWWKRTTTKIIEGICDHIPYPWGDRIDATIGNFGLWVQITLAIVVFRILIWIVISAMRRMGSMRPWG
jgi:hypothetical protein